MRTASSAYLEAARIEELASELRASGYVVEQAEPDGGFDLIASRGHERLAIEVKARARLGETARQIIELRRRATTEGFTEFRLVVVNPPRPVDVTVAGLEQILLGYMLDRMPPELDELSGQTIVDEVHSIEINHVNISNDGIRLAGVGLVEVELNYGGGSERDGLTTSSDFPMDFEVFLKPGPSEPTVEQVAVDTSSFYE